MITASNDLKNVLKNNTSIKIDLGCTVEYNLNSMVNTPTVDVKDPSTNTTLDYETINGYKPFKNLFPYTSIIDSNRPERAGVKYAVFGDISKSYTVPGTGDYQNPKTIKYNKNYRTYIPGKDSKYKYYLVNKGKGADITITYPKVIFCNKIVVKYEIAHSTPTSGTIKVRPSGGSLTTISTFTNSNIGSFATSSPGVMTLYYTGSGWSFTESALNTSAYVSIDQLEVITSAVSNSYIGIIEISPRWVVDISSDVVSFEISKEASSSNSEIVPVGLASSNSLSLNMNQYDRSVLKVLNYNKENSYAFTANRFYLYKKTKINPFFKIYHANGALGSSPNKYDQINQGSFYMDSWDISEFGDVSISALDAAKILQEQPCPDILCDNYSITAVIRNLLDSVGFTNYEIKTNSSDALESGVISPRYWWTEADKTVWQSIQELCKDSLITAVVDENNILKFYTRDYIYDSDETRRPTDWTFYHVQNSPSDPLANILSLNKRDIPNGNKVKVFWQSIVSGQYEQDGGILWTAPESSIGALSLEKDISPTDTTGNYIHLTPVITDKYSTDSLTYSFNGYFLINSEVIEYDAIEFKYKTTPGGAWTGVDIASESDLLKYRSYAAPGYENIDGSSLSFFRPSGRYRIKTRGALNSATAPFPLHTTNISSTTSGWTVINTEWL